MIAILVGLWAVLAPPAEPQERKERRYPVTVQQAYKPWTLQHRIPPLEPAWRLVWERIDRKQEHPPLRPPVEPPLRPPDPRP